MNEVDFQNKIQYRFKNVKLMEHALTHSSYINEGKYGQVFNNERLEFLGDAIFDAVISDYLYNRLSYVEEGELTKMRAFIVCEHSLAECGNRIDIGKHLYLGKGEENTGGRSRSSITADAVEAVIAAVYLDGGWEAAKTFVVRTFASTIEAAVAGKLHMDYKTEIQEKLQALGEAEISYGIVREEGPDHAKTFYVNLQYNGNVIGIGSGKSKKEAEQNAAKQAIERGDAIVF